MPDSPSPTAKWLPQFSGNGLTVAISDVSNMISYLQRSFHGIVRSRGFAEEFTDHTPNGPVSVIVSKNFLFHVKRAFSNWKFVLDEIFPSGIASF